MDQNKNLAIATPNTTHLLDRQMKCAKLLKTLSDLLAHQVDSWIATLELPGDSTPTEIANPKQPELPSVKIGQVWAPVDPMRANKQVVIEHVSDDAIVYRGLQTNSVRKVSLATLNRTRSGGYTFVAES